MFEDPDAELTLTANAQPALMAARIAALHVLEKETASSSPRTRPSSRAIRSVNIRRFVLPDR